MATSSAAQDPQAPDRPALADASDQAQDTETTDDVLTLVQSAVEVVAEPEPQALAEALGVAVTAHGDAPSDPPASSLEVLGDLDGGRVPEIALKWFLPDLAGQAAADTAGASGSWRLFLLAWDGDKWRASPLGGPVENLKFDVVRLGKNRLQGIAVVATEGEDAVPYPAVYQVKNHEAKRVWDGKADESRYEGYRRGRVEFHDAAGADSTEMIAAGRADPGLIAFPKESRRGFEVRSAYRWDGQAYVPVKTEYSPNADYTLYRFIAALHLHDFRGAYALIDPAKFPNSPTLDKFRELVEGSWPEFLGDSVFEALDSEPGSPNPYAFVLGQADKKLVYHPTFAAGEKSLLTGLERQEEK